MKSRQKPKAVAKPHSVADPFINGQRAPLPRDRSADIPCGAAARMRGMSPAQIA
jgi:hypothetical protein